MVGDFWGFFLYIVRAILGDYRNDNPGVSEVL